jgi:hypothetical protein
MAYKVLTKQQWDSLPAYKKNQMRANTPDLYNYYQDRYVTKAEPVAEKEKPMGTATVEETVGLEEDFTTAPLPTPTPIDGKVEVDDIGGTELTEVDDTAESTYTLPENEPVDVTKLPTEDQIAIWPQIKEALSKIPSTVGEILFGPDGMPTSVDEWIEWVDETLQAQMGPSNLPLSYASFPHSYYV